MRIVPIRPPFAQILILLSLFLPAQLQAEEATLDIRPHLRLIVKRIGEFTRDRRRITLRLTVGDTERTFQVKSVGPEGITLKAAGFEETVSPEHFAHDALADAVEPVAPRKDYDLQLALLAVYRATGREKEAKALYNQLRWTSGNREVANRAKAIQRRAIGPLPPVQPYDEPKEQENEEKKGDSPADTDNAKKSGEESELPSWKRVWMEGLPKAVLANPAAPDLEEVYAERNTGIAWDVPDDRGLEDHPAVLLKVDFDDGKIPHNSRDSWAGVDWPETTQPSRDRPVTGDYCAVNTWTGGDTGGTASRWNLGRLEEFVEKDKRPALFMRLYHRFDENWYGKGTVLGMKGFGFVVQAEKHNAKLKCNGRNWFASEMQWVGWGPSAKREVYRGLCIHGHYYSYMPYPDEIETTLQEQLRPTEYRFSAYAADRSWVHLDEWYCFEVAFFLNTPGKNDGEGRFWVNGKLKTRITNMRYCDVLDGFKVYAAIQNYRTQNGGTTDTVKRYIDNVVVARRYIGPIHFSRKRFDYFLKHGIVVHTGDEKLTRMMREARDRLRKTDR